VVDSRSVKDGAGVRRRRECARCGHRYTTYEGIIHAELKVIKRHGGAREDFDRDKLREGLEKACWKRPVSEDTIDRLTEDLARGIEADFDGEVTSEEIGRRAMIALRGVDEVAYVRFASVYRQFKDIDQFIDEIRALGGETVSIPPAPPPTDNDKTTGKDGYDASSGRDDGSAGSGGASEGDRDELPLDWN
jgi:transcriptional repressor NrdR